MAKRESWKAVKEHPRIYKRGDEYGIKYQKTSEIYGERKTAWKTKILTLQKAVLIDKEIQKAKRPKQKAYPEQTLGYFIRNKFIPRHFPEIRKNTRAVYSGTINILLPFIGDKKLYEIDDDDCYGFRALLKSMNLEDSTVNLRLAHLNTILDKAEDWGDISKNPMPKKIKLRLTKKEKKELNLAELKTIIERQENEKHKRMCYVSLFSGMRAGEIAGIKWSDIDFEKNTIRVQRQITYWDEETTTKSDTGIYTPFEMIPELFEKLKECKKHSDNNEFVFPGMNGRKTSDIIIAYKRKYITKGIDSLLQKTSGFHFFRHSFGSILYRQTKDIAYVSKMMRHADISITMKEYIHLIEGDVSNYTKGIRFYD